MAIQVEDLVGIPAGELREWARINGCDLEAFHELEALWTEANPVIVEEESPTE